MPLNWVRYTQIGDDDKVVSYPWQRFVWFVCFDSFGFNAIICEYCGRMYVIMVDLEYILSEKSFVAKL